MGLAHDLGCTFYDTAEVYGPYDNEILTGKGVAPFRRDIVLAAKFTLFPPAVNSTLALCPFHPRRAVF